ncbi:MAG: FHA domain-containing protein [Deltaproteobacteria bacterium]|nr:FHA domain-containing protein [Deltaproteobacteria bacterium]
MMRFKSMTVGKQQGELARFRVLGGPDNGVVFVITSPRITMGRAEDNDIMLTDIKASRKHAEITVQGGQAAIKDLGSSHGFLINGTPQKQSPLRSGDKIGLGSTVLEFIFAGESGATQMIMRPPIQTSKVVGGASSTSGLTQFIQRPTATPNMAGSTTGGKPAAPQGFLEKNKKLVIMIALRMGLTGGVQQVDQRRRKPAAYVPPDAVGKNEPSIISKEETDSPAFKQAETYFKLGKRELNSGNYLRARVAFETALQIYGNHKLSDVYLKTTKKRMEDEAKDHIAQAKRDEAANHVQVALNHYNAIKRLFSNDQSNKYYVEADKKVTDLEKRLKDMEGN